MRPNESTKNGRTGAHGLNCKIFVNSKAIFEIYEKNYIKVFSFLIVRIVWKKNFPVSKNMNSLVKREFSVFVVKQKIYFRTRLGAISQTDYEINRLVTELHKLDRDTIFVFHSDNGATPQGCNWPYRGGKKYLTEGGTISPSFIYRTKERSILEYLIIKNEIHSRNLKYS